MNSRELISVIFLSAAVWLCLSALGVILGMMQALWVAAPSEIPLLKEAFIVLRDNAILGLWVSAGVGFLGALYAPQEHKNEEIRDAFYVVFLLIAIVGTILAFFFT